MVWNEACPRPVYRRRLPEGEPGCPGEQTALDCGAGGGSAEFSWDLDTRVDSDGDGDPGNDSDARGCEVSAVYDRTGRYPARVTAVGGDGGAASSRKNPSSPSVR